MLNAVVLLSQMHPDVRKYTVGARRTATTVVELERQLMSPPVVATTCLSTDQYVDIFFCLSRCPNYKFDPVHYFLAECLITAL